MRVLIALALLIAAGAVVWRVLAPAEVIAFARDPYPRPVVAAPGVTGSTTRAPLLVQGRIRVFAGKRQVSADAPVTATTARTPRWSVRRWPQQLNGVVAVGATVISRWSDGALLAIDGATGRVAWRAAGPPAGGYLGGTTGTTTVWAAPGLVTVAATVVATGGGRAVAFDAATGATRWRVACAGGGFGTAEGAFVCGAAAYDGTTGARVRDWPEGPYAPLDCAVSASGCAAVRTTPAGVTWPTPGSEASASGGTVTTSRWRWSAPAGQSVTLLGTTHRRVCVLTGAGRLVALDAATGAVRSAFPLRLNTEKPSAWTPGRWQVADGYVVVQRRAGTDTFVVAAV